MLNFLLDTVFPKFCVGCNTEGSHFCLSCQAKVLRIKSPVCPGCNKLSGAGKFCSNCRRKTALTGLKVGAYYREPLQSAIHRFKYLNAKDLAGDLAGFLPEIDADILTFVPLYRRRKNQRGYNQAQLLASFLRDPNVLLKKVKETGPQVEMKYEERLKNLKGAFVFVGPAAVKGKKVAIVDDVATTLSTLNECAKVLREAGAKEVWGIVLARS